MARWYSTSQWNYYRKLNARGFAIRVWVQHWGDGSSEEYLLHHLLHQLDQITYHGHYSDCFIDLLQLQGNFWAFCVFIILKRLFLPYYNVVAPNEAKSSINFNLLSKLINANFPSLNFFSKTVFRYTRMWNTGIVGNYQCLAPAPRPRNKPAANKKTI